MNLFDLKKRQFVAILSTFCLVAFSAFGCGDDDNGDDNTQKCDCATGTNCTVDEKAACESEKQCDCATGTHCTDDEKAACDAQQNLCEQLGCSDGYSCHGGGCVETACIDKTCGDGEVCQKGECVEEACLNLDCSDGLICIAGKCLDPKCKDVVCIDGRTCNNEGRCELDSPAQIVVKAFNGREDTSDTPEGYAEYVVTLSAQPESDVKIAVAIDSEQDVTCETKEITLTSKNWNEGVKLRFNGVEDHVIDEDKQINVSFTASSSDTAFNSVIGNIQFTNHNTDYAHFIIEPPKDNVVYEGELPNDDNSFKVSLATIPKVPVMVGFSGRLDKTSYTKLVAKGVNGKSLACYLSEENLNKLPPETANIYRKQCIPDEWDNVIVFDESNWNVPQEIQVKLLNDDQIGKKGNYSIVISSGAYTNRVYTLFRNSCESCDIKDDPEDTDYTDVRDYLYYSLIDDDDVPQIRLVGGKTPVTHDDDIPVEVCAQIYNFKKATNISLTLSGDNGRVVLDTTEKQPIAKSQDKACFTLHGVLDDNVANEDLEYKLTFKADDSTIDPVEFMAVNEDLDKAGAKVFALKNGVPSNSVTFNKAGASQLYVRLASKPQSAVTVKATVDSSCSSLLKLAQSSLKIEPKDWQEIQTFNATVGGTDLIKSCNVSFTFESSDANYTTDKLFADGNNKVNYSITRTLGIVLEPSDFDNEFYEAEANNPKQITLKLNGKPSKDIEVRIRDQYGKLNIKEPEGVTVTKHNENPQSSVSFVFPADKWDTGLVFSLSANDDKYLNSAVDIKELLMIDSPDFSGEWVYWIHIIDDESSGGLTYTFSCDDSILDCGEHTCRIHLNNKPTGSVKVRFSIKNNNGFTWKGKSGDYAKNEVEFNFDQYHLDENIYIKYDKSNKYNTNIGRNYASFAFEFYNSDLKGFTDEKELIFFPACLIAYDTNESGKGSVNLPAGKYRLFAEGALGGGLQSMDYFTRGGGARGSYVEGVLNLTDNTNLYIHPGFPGMGRWKFLTSSAASTGAECNPDLYNCGGKGSPGYTLSTFGRDGGGSTDIRIGVDDLDHRVLVAAGGNGAGNGLANGAWNANDYVAAALGEVPYAQCPNATLDAPSPAENGNADAWRKKDGITIGNYYADTIITSTASGGGADGWAGGLVVDSQKNDKGKTELVLGHGAQGGYGFVWRDGVAMPANSTFSLDKKYQLTDVKTWGAENLASYEDATGASLEQEQNANLSNDASNRSGIVNLGIDGFGENANGRAVIMVEMRGIKSKDIPDV